MPPVEINYLAVLVAATLNMALGAFWYSPMAFGKQWMELSGISQKDIDSGKKQMNSKYGIAFLGALVMAYVLAHIIDYAQAETVSQGIQTGFWVWLGFVATVTLGSILWEGKPTKLYVLNNAYQLVTLVISGTILAVWV